MTDIKVIANRDDIIAIADAVRGKTGSTEEMTINEIVSGIENIETGVDFPELTTPAAASEVFFGKELIDQEGNVITGTFSIDSELNMQDGLITQLSEILDTKTAASGVELPTLTNPASASEILIGYEAIDENGEIITGILDNAKNIVTVYVTPNSNTVYYWDADKNLQSISNSANPITIEALNGVVHYRQSLLTKCTGNYVYNAVSGYCTYIFLEDGGTMDCYSGGGGA